MTQSRPPPMSASSAKMRIRGMLIGRFTVFAGGLTVILMLACGACLLIWTSYQRAVEQARVTAANFSTTLAAHAHSVFVAADRVLIGVGEQMRTDVVGDSMEFHRAVSSRLFHERLRAATFGVPQINLVGIVGLDGTVLNASNSFPSSGINISDRDYFQTAIRPGYSGVAVSAPIRRRSDNALTIFLARQLVGPDGHALAVILAGLSVDFFQNFYRAINIGPSSAISLFRSDGILLARMPQQDALLRASFANQTIFRGGIVAGRTEAVMQLNGDRRTDDNIPVTRVIAFKALEDFPLVVNTALTADLYLADWRQTSVGIVFGLLVICAAIAGLCFVLTRLLGWLNGTLNALDEGILLITSDHRVPLVNRRALELLGLPEKIARGVHHFEQIRDIQYANGEFFDPATGTQPPRWPLTDLGRAMAFERTRPNGTVLAISQLPLADGGAVRVIRDVTQQRKAEAELRQAQKLEALGHLTAGIAHDFNNILSVITLNLEVLENPGDLLPAEIAALLEDAIGAAQTATDLIDGLLKFSRQQALKLTPTDIAKLLTACLPLLRQALASKLVLAIDVQADLWSAEIDAAQLQSALLNLAINARDASPSGSELRITAANVSFLEEAGSPPPSDIAPGDYVLVTVADQGQGMDPAVLARVFEPFFTTKGVGVGNGLGLSMVFGTIRQMEGTVTIDSTPGAGTSVHLYLPRAAKLVSVTGS